MSTPKILIADSLSAEATAILREAGLAVDDRPGRKEAEIITDVAQYDGIIVRSATKITPAILAAATNLKVVGRAGVGVDNVDLAAATSHGVVVMNTPLGNVVSAAEHSIALIFALARNLPAAHQEMREGKWNRKDQIGVELEGKTLGVVGLGKIGQHVARVLKAAGMRVAGYDPFINPERAAELGVELLALDELLRQADFVTMHTPKTPQTSGLLNRERLALMKPTARLINVARGGIVDAAALIEALEAGRLAGAALDVFDEEPLPADSPLRKARNLILTPHLGASTAEAQTKVAEAVARQFVAYFKQGLVQNAVNLELALEPELAPYARLARLLGALAAQLAGGSPAKGVRVLCQGGVAKQNTRGLAVSALQGVLQATATTRVNLVNASQVAASRGIELVEERSRQVRDYLNLISVELKTSAGTACRVRGTCFEDRQPRITGIDDFELDLKPAAHVLIMKYADRPGMVGRFGTILGEAKVNIAGMDVGRIEKGHEAIVALTLDDPVPAAALEAIRAAVAPSASHCVCLEDSF